jgi:hypothetical protein
VIVGLAVSNLKGPQKRVTKLRPVHSERQPLIPSENNSLDDPDIIAALATEKL